MTSKICWLDCETTGLDANKHAIIQFHMIVDSNGEIVDEFELFIKPFKGDIVSKEAMQKHGISIQDLRTDKFMSPKIAFKQMITFLEKHVNRYDQADKLILAGKNIQFDIRFLRKFFEKMDDPFYGSWFHYPYIEIESEIAKVMAMADLILPNYQLSTICELFEIDLSAHDAKNDIRATRDIYYKINKEE